MTEPDDAAFAGPRGAATDATRVAPLSTRREPVDAAAQVGSEGVADDPDATRVAPISVEPSVPDSATHSSWQRLGRLPGDAVVGIGTMLKGRFLLEREIGRGGMGVVYLARDERKVEARDRDPYIAVKVLNDEFRQHPHALIALQRESRRAQHLAHDHIVRVYDFDKDGAIVFMTMEYVQGSDLRSLIRARHGNGLPMAQAWPLIAGMGQALRRAHAAGIVHSDFKPGNVMVDENTVAKVFDFGIARAAKLAGADASDDRTLFDATSLGAMTPAYASPEMLDGREPAFADDVYAFGCVVYELLAGRHPFDKRTGAQAREQGLQPAPLPGLDRRGNRALRRALAFDARQRPDMATLLAQLRPRTRRERWLRRAGVGLLALALVVVVAAVLHLQRQRQQVAQVLDGLAPGSAQRFVDETRAARALAALDSDERQRLILDHSAALEAFLLARLDAYWQPGQGRLDYASAQRLFALRERWRLFSPQLEARRAGIRQQRDLLLNALDTRLSRAVAEGRLSEDQPDNVVMLMTRIRALAPDSGLARQPELELRYERALEDALERGDRTAARRWLDSGRKAFPASTRLPAYAAQLSVGAAPTRAVARDGKALAEAEVASRIESMRTAAAAHDVAKVRDLLAQIAALRPDHPLLAGAGRQMLVDAYLGRARALALEGRWDAAAATTREGVSVAPAPAPSLRQADARYAFAVDLLRVAATPDAAAMPALRARARRLRAQDAAGYRRFATDLAGQARSRAAAALLARLQQAEPQTQRNTADACRIPGIVGSGRACADDLGAQGRGPALVVLPSPSGGALAMMRNEISVADIAAFCSATQGCKLPRQARPQAAAERMSIDLVERYARWLSEASGYTYRLPRDAQWLHAALAGGSSGACEKAVSNRWGLLNMAGGVGEWVRDGASIRVRGGEGDKDACAGSGGKAGDGNAARGIGARLVRDVK
ncbi:protein kinase [Xanthomonas translucens pv. translucens]|uniref:bifunctional serine/threonine-protein kinase/formylglycine-generating enzyme family protein n=1 Tax=Xanthomonas campestris pv. translucens TaxID=343 RepID=UPI0019D6F02E|nr:bifunctional serine/threonine-protein kinase/formylglycine-generating enzyme family protein [Xanthomonas translucens]QSQ46960.1 protein kinase [Xanthomonas translucens pv. translucens]WNJ26811.1 protein kinase [Xanthomonas translucens pv. translucens]